MGRTKKGRKALFVWPLNMHMITNIVFGQIVAEAPPPAPIGNPVGYHPVNASKPVVPILNTPVNLNSN
ncbi:hypothetical protein UFOVP328_253 [uncultured Caudovirales phage]|uniref:Uncharacterized protein n=1 Tax=uncultured Caudovirales phage TaxID=2100421 RepID=A0A6J5LZ66_9CAUD|nr:hypothetical protein UFOVP328_253 [uncultured Caudovirales phage]